MEAEMAAARHKVEDGDSEEDPGKQAQAKVFKRQTALASSHSSALAGKAPLHK